MNTYNKKNIPVVFQERIGTIHSFSYPKRQGATSEVTFIKTSLGEFVCKSANNALYRNWLRKESEVLKKLNEETDLPIPVFYGFIEEEENSYLLMSRIQGVPLRQALSESTSVEEKSKLAWSFGQLMKHLHQTKPPKSWDLSRNWLDDQLAAATYNLANYEVDGNQQLLDKLKGNKPGPVPQTVIHGDCTVDNVLVCEGVVSSLIDLSGCTYGDPRYDVALGIRAFLSDHVLLDAFYLGYEAKRMSIEEFTYFEEGLYEFF